MANQDLSSLINKLYGNNNLTQEYRGTVDKGYESLDQRLSDPGTGREDKTTEFISNLAATYADRAFQKTGQLPSEDQIRQFVAQNASQGQAAKFITGNLGIDRINALADEHLQSSPIAPMQGPENRIMGLNDQLDKIYDRGARNYVDRYNTDVYSPAKTATANDLAGQGLLTQPTSRYSLDKIEANRGKDIASGLNTLESDRAAGSLGLGKTIEDLLQSQQQINNQGRELNLKNRMFKQGQEESEFNQGLQRKQLDIASQLGRLQASGQKNNGAAGALGGAASGATAGTMIMPGWGTAIGGVAGGLAGYFGSRS